MFPRSEEPEREIRLSPREHDIISLLVQGKKRQEIADELLISRRTVDSYLDNVYFKLHVDNSDDAIRRAKRLGFVTAA